MENRDGRPLPPPDFFANFSSAYNDEIGAIFKSIKTLISKFNLDFAGRFYDQPKYHVQTSAILARLNAQELEQLKHKQAWYLDMLMSTELSAQAHYEQALHVGRVHKMVGFDLQSLLSTYHLYHQELRSLLANSGLDTEQQKRLGQAIERRLRLDIEAQINSHYRVDLETARILAAVDKAIRDTDNLPDLLHGVMEALCTLDGLLACLFSRPDVLGFLQIEAVGGEDGQSYAEALQGHQAPLIQITADTAESQGPAGRAWRSGQIQINETFELDSTLRPWRAESVRLGFRSAAAVPLLDEVGHAFAILEIYSRWPGFFSTAVRGVLLQHVQQALSHAMLQINQAVVIPISLRQLYRKRLDLGVVHMVYQPIVDLRSGNLHHIEAMAHLFAAGGQSITPAAFLPTLGRAERLRLFQLSLDQVCQDIQSWRGQGFEFVVAIDLPAEGLMEDIYRGTVFEILFRWGIPASALRFKVIDTPHPVDALRRNARIAEFQQAGIRIAQDDLGSSHGPPVNFGLAVFDAVIIDRSLVRSAMDGPIRVMEFMSHFTRFAHALNVPMHVGGLDNEGLIEAAAILGADYGQGYGIARPMPKQDLVDWVRHFSYRIDPQQPRTALGALAGYLLWSEQLTALARWLELVEDFVRAPCPVQRYLAQCDAPHEALAELLARNHAHALQGTGSPGYIETRRQLIEGLSRVWLEAGHSPGVCE